MATLSFDDFKKITYIDGYITLSYLNSENQEINVVTINPKELEKIDEIRGIKNV